MFCHTLDSAETDELRAWLRLSLTEGVGNETARQLLTAFGSPQAIFAQDAASLGAAGTERLRRAIEAEPDELPALLARTLAWLAAGTDRCILTLGDADYPATLLNIADPPLMLYLLGSLVPAPEVEARLSTLPCLAIVGSRNPTPQGHINAGQFAEALGRGVRPGPRGGRRGPPGRLARRCLHRGGGGHGAGPGLPAQAPGTGAPHSPARPDHQRICPGHAAADGEFPQAQQIDLRPEPGHAGD